MSELKSLDEIAASLPRSDASGVVLDADGRPVPGADVFLYYARHIEGLRNRLAGQSKTDAEGRFQFVQSVFWEPIVERRASILKQKYDVIAHHPERGMGFTVILEDDPAENLQVALMPTTTFDLSVHDDAGNPVEGARVRLNHLWSLDRPAWRSPEYYSATIPEEAGLAIGLTDSNGAVKLDGPATAQFIVEKDGFGVGFNSLNFVAGEPDFTKRRLEFTLNPSARVFGRVTGPDSQPVRGAAVWYMSVDKENLQIARHVTVTDQAGRYRFANVAPGDTTNSQSKSSSLVAEDLRLGSNLVGLGEKIMLRAGDEETCDLRLAPGAVLAGQVVDDETGKPLPRMSLRCSDIDESRLQYNITTDEQGRFRLLYPPGMEVTLRWGHSHNGTYLLSEDQLRQEAWRGALTGDVTGLTLKAKLLPVGTLEGLLLDPDGAPASEPHSIYIKSVFPRSHNGPDGRFTINAATLDQDFELFALSPDKQCAALVRCKAGAASVTMRTQWVRDYAGVVLTTGGKPAGNLKFDLSLLLNGADHCTITQELKTDEAGRFVARGLLPTASYRARWREEDQDAHLGYDFGRVTIDLPGLELGPGELITFNVKRFVNTLRGKVVDDLGQPVSGAEITIPLSMLLRTACCEHYIGTDQHGVFTIKRLAEGKVKLKASHPDFRSRTIETDTNARDCLIRLTRRADELAARIQVLDEMNRPVPYAPVTVTLFASSAWGKDVTETNPLQIDGQGRGEFRMNIYRPDTGRTIMGAIFCCDKQGCDLAFDSLKIDEEDREIVLRLRSSREHWSGQVVDEADNPIAGAQVVIQDLRAAMDSASLRLSGAPGCSVITGVDGRFEFPRIGREGILWFTVLAPGYVRGYGMLSKSDYSGIVTLKRGGAISGKAVIKATGVPCAGGRVIAALQDGGFCNEDAPLAEDGSFRFDGLPPDDYLLVIKQIGAEPLQYLSVEPAAVTVRAGETAVVMLELDEGVLVRGRLSKPVAVEASSGDVFVCAWTREYPFWEARARVCADGSWQMRLNPGVHDLQCGYMLRGSWKRLGKGEQPIAIEKGKAYDNVVIEVK